MTKNRLGDGPIDPAYQATMRGVAEALDEVFNGKLKGSARTTGFVLLVFPFGTADERCNFISNGADRRDLIALFKEMAARFEGQPEMKGEA